MACLDPSERSSDKRGFNLPCDHLRPTATRETFLAGSPQTRPSSSWLVGVSCRVRLRSCTMVSDPSAWSPTFFGKSQDGLTSADEPRTTEITKLYQVQDSSSMFKLSSMQIPSNSSLLVLACRTCVSRQWLSAWCWKLMKASGMPSDCPRSSQSMLKHASKIVHPRGLIEFRQALPGSCRSLSCLCRRWELINHWLYVSSIWALTLYIMLSALVHTVSDGCSVDSETSEDLALGYCFTGLW